MALCTVIVEEVSLSLFNHCSVWHVWQIDWQHVFLNPHPFYIKYFHRIPNSIELSLQISNENDPKLIWFHLTPVWTSNHSPIKVWDEITHPFPNLNDTAMCPLRSFLYKLNFRTFTVNMTLTTKSCRDHNFVVTGGNRCSLGMER